jgi:hypothetical protein
MTGAKDMDTTETLQLPYIAPAQAQKHVTHNEAIRMLDALVQLSVVDRDRQSPPEAPDPGDRHIVGAAAEGEWAGQEGKIAAFQDGGWSFYAPRLGWLAWIEADQAIFAWRGTGWQQAARPQSLPFLGLNATADATNRLSINAPASLFSHEDGDHRLVINKGMPADTAAILFQTGFSGRAEFGLAGDDAFRIKVSPDGTSWSQPLTVQPDTGFIGIATDEPTTALHVNGALRVLSYSKAALPPAAAAGSGAILHVYDEAGGSTLAFSDGGSWRRVTDRAVVS